MSSIGFEKLDSKDNEVEIDILPCLFSRSEDEVNRHLYFDSQLKDQHPEDGVKTASLRGYKIKGKEFDPKDYALTCVIQETSLANQSKTVQIIGDVKKITVWEQGEKYRDNNDRTTLHDLLNYRQILAEDDE
ncbi:unnamed protein product [Moneuplotes crassus]|uniref:Uncharacterized protein n=1 Tax=Euplotes crassus TaxID=5936 RepID=A0AAD2D8V6_EUPCR|nr:unnamed protein product [Moneuplotes crassus]